MRWHPCTISRLSWLLARKVSKRSTRLARPRSAASLQGNAETEFRSINHMEKFPIVLPLKLLIGTFPSVVGSFP
jgi:hypothetical protein